MCPSEESSVIEDKPRGTAAKRKILSAVIATAIVLVSTIALVRQSGSVARTNPPIRVALSYLAVPGFAVGALIDMVRSGNIHGGGSDLPFFVSVPVNWLLYYAVILAIFKLWHSLLRRK